MHQALVALLFEQGLDFLDLVAKGFGSGQYGAFEMADFAFVVVAHVHNDGIGLAGEGVELFCRYVLPAVCHIETAIIEAIGDDFVSHLNDQLQKALVVAFNGDVQSGIAQPIDVFQRASKRLEFLAGQTELSIDAFIADIDATQNADGTPCREEVIPQEVGVGDFGIAVKTQCGPWTAILFKLVEQGFLVPFIVEMKLGHAQK